jgi:transposase
VGRDWRDDRIEELEAQLRARDERIAQLEQQGASLTKQIAELSAKLGQNSTNSHLPPSTDSPDERRKRRNKNKAKQKERKRRAQHGHTGAHRELLPLERISKFVELFPPECESC